jgi:predicted transcriptional regulator
MAKKLARGELEARVMGVLWDSDGWMTPAAVHAAITTKRRRLAYTTIMTILVRLYTKGMLHRRREGRAFAYRPVATREEWAAQRMREFLEAVGDRNTVLSHFVDGIDAREAARLRQLLKGRRTR